MARTYRKDTTLGNEHTAPETKGVTVELLAALCTPRTAFAWGTWTGAIGIGLSFHWGFQALLGTFDDSHFAAVTVFVSLVALEAIGFGLFSLVASMAAHRPKACRSRRHP